MINPKRGKTLELLSSNTSILPPLIPTTPWQNDLVGGRSTQLADLCGWMGEWCLHRLHVVHGKEKNQCRRRLTGLQLVQGGGRQQHGEVTAKAPPPVRRPAERTSHLPPGARAPLWPHRRPCPCVGRAMEMGLRGHAALEVGEGGGRREKQHVAGMRRPPGRR
jgi:hypothetical protein